MIQQAKCHHNPKFMRVNCGSFIGRIKDRNINFTSKPCQLGVPLSLLQTTVFPVFPRSIAFALLCQLLCFLNDIRVSQVLDLTRIAKEYSTIQSEDGGIRQVQSDWDISECED